MNELGGRYEVIETYSGGMGKVYIVRDQLLDEVVAAKTFKHLFRLDENFFQEISVWIKLSTHANIIQALYAIPIRDMPFLFMEYAQKGSLANLLGQLDWGLLPSYLFDICQGMEHLHDLEILHLDLKPANILLVERDNHIRASLSDFGLAYSQIEQSIEPLGGTIHYMAPELFGNSPKPQNASDIYSFGIMCYQMLAGHLPFTATEHDKIIQMHKFGNPKPLNLEKNAFKELLV